jgi:hypothetical protein
MSDPLFLAQRLLDDSVAAERERVEREREAMRVRGAVPLPEGTRLEVPPRPELPPDTVPAHETPRPDGLAADTSVASYVFKRWTPFKRRWPEVIAFDERVVELEQKQAGVNAELSESREQLPQIEQNDRDALAAWVADPSGCDRPLPAAPAVRERITELEAEREATELAARKVLDEKTRYVDRHRVRLRKEAAKERRKAVKQLQAAIAAVDQAREGVVDCVRAEVWAKEFPGPDADAGSLALQMVRGGRLVKAIPGYQGQLVAQQLTEAMRGDCDWLDSVVADELEDGEVDPDKQAIWLDAPESRPVIARKNKEIAEGLIPKDARAAQWS